MDYVCGFLFDKERTSVLLVKKIKPVWMAGMLNGIGGKIKNDKFGFPESPLHAMERECIEELGWEIKWEKLT